MRHHGPDSPCSSHRAGVCDCGGRAVPCLSTILPIPPASFQHFFLLKDRVSAIQGWLLSHCVAEDDPDLWPDLCLLRARTRRCEAQCSVYTEDRPRALWVLDRHSSNQAMFSAPQAPLRQGSTMSPWLTRISLCRPGWP